MADQFRGMRPGVFWSGGSSAVVALLGIATLLAVGRWQGPTVYAGFSVVWGLYFGIGGVFAGIQQEVTRSVGAADGRGEAPLAPMTLALGLVVGVAGAGLMLQLDDASDSTVTPSAVAVGLIGLAGMTFVSGVLAAQSDWPALALVLVVDAGVRTAVVVSLSAAGLASLLPVGIASGAVAWMVLLVSRRYRLAFLARGDASALGFAGRAVTAMGSTGCAALLVAGLPLLVATFRSEQLDAGAGSVLAALVLIRSVLLVPLYGFRPVILRAFLDSDRVPALVWRTWGWCILLGVGWTLAATALGPPALALVMGESFSVTNGECAALAAGAAGIMLLVTSGLALVACDRHLASGAGWLLAVVVSAILVPIPSEARSSVALASLGGPWVGVAAHAWFLVRRRPAAPAPQDTPAT